MPGSRTLRKLGCAACNCRTTRSPVLRACVPSICTQCVHKSLCNLIGVLVSSYTSTSSRSACVAAWLVTQLYNLQGCIACQVSIPGICCFEHAFVPLRIRTPTCEVQMSPPGCRQVSDHRDLVCMQFGPLDQPVRTIIDPQLYIRHGLSKCYRQVYSRHSPTWSHRLA